MMKSCWGAGCAVCAGLLFLVGCVNPETDFPRYQITVKEGNDSVRVKNSGFSPKSPEVHIWSLDGRGEVRLVPESGVCAEDLTICFHLPSLSRVELENGVWRVESGQRYPQQVYARGVNVDGNINLTSKGMLVECRIVKTDGVLELRVPAMFVSSKMLLKISWTE